MEAATNYLVANNDDVELLKDSSFNMSVTANESFTGQEVESYLTTIIDNCKGIINSYDLSEEYARIGIVDLTLEDNAIKVDVIITRKLVSPYSASKWICHDGEEYPYSSTLLINSSGQQVIVPDFNCAGTSYDGYGINHFMSARLTAKLRGYECEYDIYGPVLIPCDKQNAYLHSVGSWTNNGTSQNWGNGCYSVPYPYLMPHSSVSNWYVQNTCHSGVAIRCVNDNRIYPWIQNYMANNYTGFNALFANVWRPAIQYSNQTNVMRFTVVYGKCTLRNET